MLMNNFIMTKNSPINNRVRPKERLADKLIAIGPNLTEDERGKVILQYAPLVKYVANRLAMRLPPNISIDDLVSAGVIGLIDAIDKFDPDKNIKFKTYAEFRIRGAMLDELRSMDWVPRSLRKKAGELERAYSELEQALGRPAEDEEVADALGIGLDDFYRLIDETKNITFLDIDVIKKNLPEGGADEDLFDLISDEGKDDPFSKLNLLEVKEILREAIQSLPEKERLVVTLYYYEELTMREIGEVMGYTESRISQMHTKAMLRLRARLKQYKEELFSAAQ